MSAVLVDHLLKTKKEYKNSKQQEEIHNIFIKKKTSFQHDTAYGDFKDLPQRTASDETLCNEAFNIARNLKHDGIKEVLF